MGSGGPTAGPLGVVRTSGAADGVSLADYVGAAARA